MDYNETRTYLKDIKKYGIVPGLDTIKNLMELLENPQDDLNIIHIAGTNGKGSTGAFIESILIHAGYKVCRYATPAVFDDEEILKYNGRNITKDEVAFYITKIKSVCDMLTSSGLAHPTPFEIETAMGFLYCKDKNCDYAILESGMGGLLDAVNVIKKSKVSVITSISMDHTAYLGDTIEEITRHKTGIIKENGMVVSSVQDDVVIKIINDEVKKKNATLIISDKMRDISSSGFDYDDMEDIKISLDGQFQVENAATAIEVCTMLGVCEDEIRSGLNNTSWAGRFEKINDEPVFIIDGAHNISAVEKLIRNIEIKFKEKNLNFIVGIFKDKDYKGISKLLAPVGDKIYTVTPNNPRALDRDKLMEEIYKYNKNVYSTDILSAVNECLADTDSVTIAFGSLSYLKDVKRIVENEKMQ